MADPADAAREDVRYLGRLLGDAIVVFAPEAREAKVQGSAAHVALAPLPATLVIVRFVGVSVTRTSVASDGPAFAIRSVKVTL